MKRVVNGDEATTELIFRGVGGDNSVRIPADVIMPEDKGEYTCRAENGWGNAEESNMKLTVLYQPRVDQVGALELIGLMQMRVFIRDFVCWLVCWLVGWLVGRLVG